MSFHKSIPAQAHSEILARLARTEREEGVRILLAVESGSRAWGFPSPNSDYDVRFIYAHPADWYMAVDLEERRDVIEYPITDDFDISGWDLRKALRLFLKSNPSLVEWLQSPIVYIESGGFAARARVMLKDFYSKDLGIYHYRRMAQADHRGNLRDGKVSLKSYFYALRAVLSVRWIERHDGVAPIEFSRLLAMIGDQPALLAEIQALLEQKLMSPERGLTDPVPSIQDFLQAELERLEPYRQMQTERRDVIGQLNALFREILGEGNG